MRRQPTAELYRKFIEEPSLRYLAAATALFLIGSTAFMLLDHQSVIDNAMLVTRRLADAQAESAVQEISNRVNPVVNYLNRTAKMFRKPHLPVSGICETLHATCDKNSQSPMAILIASTYLYQSVLYNNLFNGDFQPQPFFYSKTSHELIALTFSLPFLISSSKSILDSVRHSLQATRFDGSRSNWYFLTNGLLISCRQVEAISWMVACMSSRTSQLLQASTNWRFNVWLNADIHIPIAQTTYTSPLEYFKEYRDQLLKKNMLNTEGWMNVTYNAQFLACCENFLKSLRGQMECGVGSKGFHMLPVMMTSKTINLPVLSNNLSAYTLTAIPTNFLYFVMEVEEQAYRRQLNTIELTHLPYYKLFENCLFALMGAVMLVMCNRIYVRLWLVETIDHLCDDSLSPKRMISELSDIVIIAEQYKWLGSLAEPYSEEHLLRGLEIFRSESQDDANYLSALEFIYRELIHIYDCRRQFFMQLPFYEKLIRLKLKVHKTSSVINSNQVNQVFQLEVEKALCFCRALRNGQVQPNTMYQQSNKIIERLDQYPQNFEIEQSLLEEATLTEYKIRQALGRPVSYRRLEQLAKSDNERIRTTALYLIAYQLSLRKFDAEAISYLWSSLTTGSTSNNFKCKRLYFLWQLAERNDWNQQQLRELEFMARSFNQSHRRLFILIDSMEGLEERLVFAVLHKVIESMGKDDVVELISLQTENRQNTHLLVSDPNIQELVRDNLIRLSAPLEGSRRSKSVIEGLVYHFQRLVLPSSNFQNYSQYVMILISDGILNDERSEKQTFKRPICKNLTIGDSYMHLLLIGNHIKSQQFQRSKVVKALRQAQTFLQIDLKNFDRESTNEDLEQFFEAGGN